MGGKSLEQEDTQKAGAMTQARDEQGSDEEQGRSHGEGLKLGTGVQRSRSVVKSTGSSIYVQTISSVHLAPRVSRGVPGEAPRFSILTPHSYSSRAGTWRQGMGNENTQYHSSEMS